MCFLVSISYAENIYSLANEDFVMFDGYYVLNKRLSWMIGGIVEYNLFAVLIMAACSIAFNTCVWNKLAVVYLAAQLIEKKVFISQELYTEQIYAINAINIILCILLIYKGLQKTKNL